MRGKFLLIVFSLILFTNFVCSEFVFSEIGSSITTQYETSEYLNAKINMSFSNESLNSSFKDSLGNYITLKDLLTKTPSFGTINETFQTINSSFYVISFNVALFSLPDTVGNISYELNFSETRIFKENIKITSSDYSIQGKIDEKQKMLSDIKLEIKKFDYSIEQMLYRELKLTEIEARLNRIEIEYPSASNEEYELLLKEVSDIKIPKSVQEIQNSTKISFYPKDEYINPEILALIAGRGNYTSENSSKYITAIETWYVDNLKTKIQFKEMLISYDKENQTRLKIFYFEFVDKTQLKNDAYFIIEDLGDIVFEENYFEKELNGYIYMEISDISKITLSTKEDINLITIPVFIAPSLEDIEIPGPIEPWKPIYWFILFGLIIFLILLISIVIYAGMQMWYRRRYENALFKNRNNLYNIMTYIQHSKRKGISREHIMKNLKKAKWRREQINYALNKYEGKKIAGIIERPFKKVLEEIEKNTEKYPQK